jgi:hypothetical protein
VREALGVHPGFLSRLLVFSQGCAISNKLVFHGKKDDLLPAGERRWPRSLEQVLTEQDK